MDYTIYLAIAPFAAIVSALAWAFVFKHRNEAAARALLWYLGQVAALLIGNTLELLSPSQTWTLHWARINHLFFSFIPVAWLGFAAVYAGGQRVVRSGYFLLFTIFPVVTNILVHTNSLHHLFWREISFFEAAGFTTFRATYGPWFWANGLYYYGLLVLGAVILGRAYFGGVKLYRRQSAWIIAGVLTPLLFNLAYVFRVFEAVRKDYTPLSFAIAGVFFVVGVYRFRLFDVVPIARAALFDDMDSAVLVLDEGKRIVDINASARDLFGVDESVLGAPYRDVAPVADLLREQDLDVFTRFDAQIGLDSLQRHYEIEIQPFSTGSTGAVGTMVTIHDVTERVRLLQEKTRLVEELEKALSEITHLRGIIPICSVCKKIRDDAGFWHQVEAYIAEHSDAEFSHGLCDECASRLYSDLTDG